MSAVYLDHVLGRRRMVCRMNPARGNARTANVRSVELAHE